MEDVIAEWLKKLLWLIQLLAHQGMQEKKQSQVLLSFDK